MRPAELNVAARTATPITWVRKVIQPIVASPQRLARTPGEPLAARAPERADEGSNTLAYALGGLGALALALAASFLWYRRRLP